MMIAAGAAAGIEKPHFTASGVLLPPVIT